MTLLIDITDIKTTKNRDDADRRLAQLIGDKLYEVYPGFNWFVNVDWRTGIATIQCGEVQDSILKLYGNQDQYKYILKLSDLYSYGATVRLTIFAGAEILERANLPRGYFRGDAIKQIDGVTDKRPVFKGFILP
jgi:hypothetical protein